MTFPRERKKILHTSVVHMLYVKAFNSLLTQSADVSGNTSAYDTHIQSLNPFSHSAFIGFFCEARTLKASISLHKDNEDTISKHRSHFIMQA